MQPDRKARGFKGETAQSAFLFRMRPNTRPIQLRLLSERVVL